MADPALSAPLAEAYASAPVDEIIYHTLELRHSAFASPIRVARDHVTLAATLEADAPLNPGEEVNFAGYGFDLKPPDVTGEASPTLGIEIDNVSREIVAAVESATLTTDLIEATYRAYLASDLTAPQNDPPLTLTISRVSCDLMRVSASAGFDDLSNRRFPAATYTADDYPGLLQQ